MSFDGDASIKKVPSLSVAELGMGVNERFKI